MLQESADAFLISMLREGDGEGTIRIISTLAMDYTFRWITIRTSTK